MRRKEESHARLPLPPSFFCFTYSRAVPGFLLFPPSSCISLILSLSYDASIPPEHYHSLEQLRDHADPTVPCALLKASIVASGILGITGSRHDQDESMDSEKLSSNTTETTTTGPMRTMADLLKPPSPLLSLSFFIPLLFSAYQKLSSIWICSDSSLLSFFTLFSVRHGHE
jgi:hypothetical protein